MIVPLKRSPAFGLHMHKLEWDSDHFGHIWYPIGFIWYPFGLPSSGRINKASNDKMAATPEAGVNARGKIKKLAQGTSPRRRRCAVLLFKRPGEIVRVFEAGFGSNDL